MNAYGQANSSDKVIEMGRKAIAADPTNPVPLVQVGSALAEGTRDTDMDRDQRLAEAAKDAQGAIDNINNLMAPPGAPADRVAAVKASIVTMAYDTLGMVDLNKKDYAGAEQQLQKAVDASKAQPEAVVYSALVGSTGPVEAISAGTRFRHQGRAICATGKCGTEPGEAATGSVAETDG